MLLVILSSVAATVWILFAAGLYFYHYVLEVVLDLPLTGQQSPCTAHAALKQLIEKILKEVLNLPQLQQPLKGTPIPPDLNNGTYEELLATAILNKAISNSQNPRPSSSAASVSSRISNISHAKEEKEYFFGDETLDNKWRHQDIETTSISSLEDWLQSDSSFGSKKYVDRVTLTIKQDIEELSHASESDEDDEDDDSEYFRTKSSLWDDDEPNWFLQKRTFQGTHSPVPVPMLVPNPTTEAKVLIGDQEVDDTSDLSDVGSDYGDTEIVPTRHNLLVNSKTVIGGKNPLINGGVEGESESESSADSGVKEVDRGQSVYDDSEFTDRADGGSQGGYEPPPTFVSRADISIDDDNIEDASLMSVYSNTEQEAEYTERYASLPRTIEKKPDPPIRLSLQKNKPDVSNNEIERNEATEEKEDEEVKIVQMHFSGNYSKREKEKWKNAIEMKNNPYSKENIERRIKRSSSGAGSLFGSDYYAKLASSPSGTKSRSLEAKGLSWPPQSPPSDEEDSITTEATTITIDGTTTVPDKSESKTYVAAEEDKDVFRAVRMIIDVYGDNEVVVSDIPATEVEASPAKPLENIPELTSLTSDSDLSYVHVYNVENAKISKKSNKPEEGEPKPESVMKERNGNVETYPSTPQRQFSSPADSHKFIKSANASTRRPVVSTQRLKRHKSETDLLVDDSFYTVPKPLGMKKDNTLISKIYLDPQVRNFALINRRQLPVNPVVPTFRSQFSNSAESTSEQKAYYSDDGVGLSREKKFTVYRSIEDLYNNSTTIDVKNGTMVQTAQMFLSSEDDQYSERSSVYTDQRIRQNYSSSEDLSIDELETPKKKDNTLISKIYQQPTVRNYALANRYTIPAQESKALEKSASSEDEVFSDISRVPKIGSPKDISEVETQLEAMEVKEKETRKVSIENENDPGVETIAKRKIVHNLVGKFSGSQTHLEKWENKDDVHEENISISVKDLRKMFEKKQGKNNVVSSLTARSVSKQLKEELRN